jgi:hypothetical protein
LIVFLFFSATLGGTFRFLTPSFEVESSPEPAPTIAGLPTAFAQIEGKLLEQLRVGFAEERRSISTLLNEKIGFLGPDLQEERARALRETIARLDDVAVTTFISELEKNIRQPFYLIPRYLRFWDT